MTYFNDQPLPRYPKPEKRPTGKADGQGPRIALYLALTAVVCAALGAVVGASVTSKPGGASDAPTPITETVEDPTCRNVAVELKGILDVAISDALIPYSEVTQTLADQAMYGYSLSDIEEATTKVQGAGDAAAEMNDRVAAIRGDYQKCTK